ncbi:MAG: mannonate dehydratase [Ahrensia sp.]
MRETWRWFGEYDQISLAQVLQTGAQGIVSALHAIPYGQVWTRQQIAARRDEIEAAGLRWDVVESLPVHENIKKGTGDLEPLFDNYRASLTNLAAEGVRTVCYNFMPVLDWTRTDLTAPVANGGTCLRFSAAKMAAFEVHMLGRAEAVALYSPAALEAGAAWHEASSQEERDALLHAIMAGLPGAVDRYDIEGLKTVLESYRGVSHNDLRANLKRFLNEVIPVAQEHGIKMCIHPDDPPFDILGLPRIVSNEDDIAWILSAVDSPANGLTLCSGSLGARADNDIARIAGRFGSRVHFAHLRNVSRDADGSFEESAHLDGDVDMVAVISALLAAERQQATTIPMRADHGHALLTDIGRDYQPGYTLIGRLRGLSELRGMMRALRPQQ